MTIPINARRARRRVLVTSLLAAAVIVPFVFTPATIRVLADWYWFEAIGYERVFLTSFWTKLLLGLSVWLAALLYFAGHMKLAQRGAVPDPLTVNLGGGKRLDLTAVLRRFTWPVAVLLSLPTGLAAASAWRTVQLFLHRTPFGVADPVFGRDVGYYVFTLPVISWLLGLLFTLTFLSLLLVVPPYLLRRDIVFWQRRVTIEPSAAMHLAALAAILFWILGVRAFLVDVPSLVYSTTGPLFGASYTDLVVRAPMIRVAGVAAFLAGALMFVGARRQRLVRYALLGAAGWIGVLFAGGIASSSMQKLVVAPNELVKESPQLQHHIAATRAAWGLDRVTVGDLSGEAVLTADDIARNQGTIRNVRLWDRDPLLQTFGQLQSIRTYYDFVSVDDDRYWIDGEYRQVLLSPRELNVQSLPTRTFINEHLTFTHGMGLTLSPVNMITGEGLPVLFVKDLPPVSTVSLEVRRPAIYYGEVANDFVVVRSQQQEFDYPAGEENAFTTYEGTGGVPVSSYLRRLVLSMRFASTKVLLSRDITAESRVMYHRTVEERAARALPFLRLDEDPYIVIDSAGRLKWIIDAYTATDRYPYSQPRADGINYMRNSVKVVIDAYDGDVRAYAVDADDPLLRTWRGVFPGLIQPLDSMPADLRAHIRYPTDLFRTQIALYTAFHMDEPSAFYHREDQWQIPAGARGEGASDPFIRHIVMKLPGESQEEYILMAPFTPRQKDNLAAWMVARNDGEHYGQLAVYRFPRQSLIYGPTQVVNRINQDTEISRQVSLWDQRGSQVIRGNLLVIPIEESLIYVQALYLRAEGGRIPELKRVIVSHQNQVVMEETLEAGLARLFGGATGRPSEAPAPAAATATTATTTLTELIGQAESAYQRALAAQRAGDWARYGEEMRRVGELLQQLRDRAGTSP